ncbi:hypothetical protein F751_3464 [Auxenochlorella protothecoides]|uniref:Uncharacterized protein n=1 Tax=Auxenochlorella protothecoides TaxID=3075 RepID=A0A087SC19_AUXPR|nr:hypothetical protein F751_3464 [Auxenochlorella protothecoides]KFM23273.1 hypothetical protein F751_3464 [Auxenochlorella protothecoides]
MAQLTQQRFHNLGLRRIPLCRVRERREGQGGGRRAGHPLRMARARAGCGGLRRLEGRLAAGWGAAGLLPGGWPAAAAGDPVQAGR